MRIGIYGMGYVGAVSAACFADAGHTVIGVDVSADKVDLINRGESPIVEPGLGELLGRAVAQRRLQATRRTADAMAGTDLSLICVGTPSLRNGDLDLSHMEAVCREIGAALRARSVYHTVVVRSTVIPGTVRNLVIPILQSASGKVAGEDFGVAVNPEFLREGTAIRDFSEPPMTIIGEFDTRSGESVAPLYTQLPAPLMRRELEVAEMVKYACNAWHATKITFANEIGSFAKAIGVDGREVMEIVCLDRKLNISSHYLRPGFAFGGSCLPKDLRALTFRASQLGVEVPMLGSVLRSNRSVIERAVDMIESYGEKRVGLLGLSFKAGTDDLRESPLVQLAETLLGKGFQLSIFDRNVEYARVHGANREYINSRIPHVSSLLKPDLEEVLRESDVMVLGNKDKAYERALRAMPEDKKWVDLVGFLPHGANGGSQGIAW
ncbi:MAG: nucleotide sugar dehydrogenase [Nevskiaceae bacterium]